MTSKKSDIDSWKSSDFQLLHNPEYKNQEELEQVIGLLKQFPGLVSVQEILDLKVILSDVQDQKSFLLQGGDCAESFKEFSADHIESFSNIFYKMRDNIQYATGKNIVLLGRLAGQFAKPRSSRIEKQDDVELESYKGDIINSIEFSESSRIPNPNNMLTAYYQSAAKLNYLKQKKKDKISLRGQDSLYNNKSFDKYQSLIKQVEGYRAKNQLQSDSDIYNQIYVSHEALLLEYETALTRYDDDIEGYYNSSAHMVWVGNRTRALDSAHIEYLSSIINPLGVKIDSKIKGDELISLIDKLNPTNEKGKIILISRMGVKQVEDSLLDLINYIEKSGRNVIWSCDPMHGNIEKTGNGYKTRKFENIIGEIDNFFECHRKNGSYAGGIHLEMTGQNVSECVGGSIGINENHLPEGYTSLCDPRLNAMQSLELSLLLAKE